MIRKIFSAWLLVALSVAHSATTTPIQLLNPSGSTSGQAIVSTGPSTAPAWGNVTATSLGSQAANTVVANFTGSSASPTAFAMPSCSASGSALLYTSGTGVTCGSSFAMTTGATFTGSITPSQTAGIVGTTTNNNANAGSVGEYVCAQVTNGGSPIGCQTNSGTPVSLTSGTPGNITSVSLTAGDWDVSGAISFLPNSSTAIQLHATAVGTTSASLGNDYQAALYSIAAGTGVPRQISPVVRISISSTTTVYLVGQANFTTSTLTAYGFIRARRVR